MLSFASLGYIQPICLPPAGVSFPTLVGAVTVAGWGESEHQISSDVLLKVDLPVIGKAECRRFNLYRTRLVKGPGQVLFCSMKETRAKFVCVIMPALYKRRPNTGAMTRSRVKSDSLLY